MRVLAILLFVALAVATACQKESDCYSVSESPHYVECDGFSCSCLANKGFSGSASVSSKCGCPLPKTVVVVKGDLYCVDLSEAIRLVSQAERCEILKAKVAEVYYFISYPRNLGVITGQVDFSDVFAENTVARITPVGEFADFEGVLEYFYGLGTLPTNFIASTNTRYTTCEDNLVQFRIDLLMNQSANPVSRVPFVNFTHFGRFEFDDDNLISKVDITFTNLGAAVDIPADKLVEAAPGQFIPARLASMIGICTILSQTCVGPYQQYESVDECVGFMQTIPYGTYDRAFSNSYTCRSTHTLLTPFRPQIHCAHAGPTGGGKCIDFPYEEYYTNDFY
jgi:hypothetical protein